MLSPELTAKKLYKAQALTVLEALGWDEDRICKTIEIPSTHYCNYKNYSKIPREYYLNKLKEIYEKTLEKIDDSNGLPK